MKKNTKILAYNVCMPHNCSHVSSVHSHAFYAICTLHCSNKAAFITLWTPTVHLQWRKDDDKLCGIITIHTALHVHGLISLVFKAYW